MRPSEERERVVAFVVGSGVAVGVLGLYVGALLHKGRADFLRALAFNAPIAWLFLVVLVHLAVRLVARGLRAGVRLEGASLLFWACGAVLLYLRLVSKSLEVSGHMVWLPLLTAEALTRGFPRWFVGCGLASTVAALYMKLAIFGGPSGAPGTAVGVLLAGALIAHRSGQGHQKAG